MGDATEHLSTHYGSTLGSLINVTFGNTAEIIIAIVAINAGLLNLVKASITRSILGNKMLIFGLSMIAGGFRHKKQLFNKENAGLQSSLIFLAQIGLAISTVLSSTMIGGTDIENQAKIQILSDSVAILLLFVYIVGIIFTFFTHKHLFAIPHSNSSDRYEEHDHNHWSKKKSFLMLGVSMIGVIVVSEILVRSVEETSREFGFGEMFVGAIIVGIVGNAAEHSSAIILARKGKLDLSIGIAAGSGTQITLFVVPILVLVGIVLGQPFTLEFTIYELVTLFLAAIIINLIAFGGKTNWFEGVMLTSVLHHNCNRIFFHWLVSSN
ncbi:MAG TPA: calcium/proton exchanger [Nitrososphaeraceae archaeon]|nr:calcium/proton exchanger [Nitrososphaeraceae archaeon]